MGIINELYELSEDYLQVLDMMDDDTWDEQTVLDTLEGVEGEFEYKVESIIKIVKTLLVSADVDLAAAKRVEEEKNRLASRAESKKKKAEFFKDVIYQNMKAVNKKKVKTDLFTVFIAANGGKEPLVVTGSFEDIPGKYLIPQDPKLDNDAIRALLKEKTVDWAHLEPRGEHLGIR